MVLGLDTATPATAVALLGGDGTLREARHDPAADERPGHSGLLLALVEEVVADAWGDVERVAVGLGPGGFTGLRIGIATARALAQARDLPLVGVPSLDALAGPARAAAGGRRVLALIDARRGEAFAAAYDAGGRRDLEPCALGPEELIRVAPGHLAVGDGAVRFRSHLEGAGAAVPADGDPLHRLSAAEVCRLAAQAAPVERDTLVPHYVREPDATARPVPP